VRDRLQLIDELSVELFGWPLSRRVFARCPMQPRLLRWWLFRPMPVGRDVHVQLLGRWLHVHLWRQLHLRLFRRRLQVRRRRLPEL